MLVGMPEPTQPPTEKTQLTQPKEGEPIEIPVPKEDDFEKLVRRAVKGAAEPRADEAD